MRNTMERFHFVVQVRRAAVVFKVQHRIARQLRSVSRKSRGKLLTCREALVTRVSAMSPPTVNTRGRVDIAPPSLNPGASDLDILLANKYLQQKCPGFHVNTQVQGSTSSLASTQPHTPNTWPSNTTGVQQSTQVLSSVPSKYK